MLVSFCHDVENHPSLTVTWIAVSTRRGQPAALRHQVWALGILGALALPFLTTLLPAWHVGALGNAAVHLQIVPGVGQTTTTKASTVVNAASSVPWSSKLISVALVLWALGSLLIVLKLLVGLARLVWTASRSKPMFEEKWMRTLADLSESFGVGRSVRMLQCAVPGGPRSSMMGVLRPRIILPAGAAERSQEMAAN